MQARINLFNKHSDTVEYKAGDTIFRKGDPADFMYIIQEGEVEIHLSEGNSIVYDAGLPFGEMAFIDKSVRNADATARTDCRLVPLDEKRFNYMVMNTPNFALQLMRIFSERLRIANRIS